MPKTKPERLTKRMFRDPSGQTEFFEKSLEEELETQKTTEVECLDIKFPNDEARRAYFLEKLREKLKDPEFRKIEGFPIGKDEDILALSDPPYYTACPNPFIEDLIRCYGKPYDPKSDPYRREPFAADVSEGKNDPIYNAHSYHTKVPHKAIMRYILHYSEPGDVVFDGFCGTGMTGVAALLCGDPAAITDLGYLARPDGSIQNADQKAFSRCGARLPILNDLSPAATLIAAGYNLSIDPEGFSVAAKKLLDRFNREYGWMYLTEDRKTGSLCPIHYTVWSEIFSCPHCSYEIEYWKHAYDESSGRIEKEFKCPHCSAKLTKRDLKRRTTTYFDKGLQATRARQLLRPVEIRYEFEGATRRKKPDDKDFAVLTKVEKLLASADYPTDLMMFVPEGEEWGDLYRGYHEGISRVHDFSLPRQLAAFSVLWRMGNDLPSEEMKRLWRFTLQGVLVSFTRRNRFRKQAYSQVNTNLSGTLYIGSTISEPSPSYALAGKIKRFKNAIPKSNLHAAIATGSLVRTGIPDDSVDYIFVDPPFGGNLPYAELNFPWEAWLRVFTKAPQDAVVSDKQHKDLSIYTSMMTAGMREACRILKPGRWITVEFHNSKNSVWAAIQEALGQAGFIIADVSILDKEMKTKKQMHARAVDKDLVISAYKPNGGLEHRFRIEAGTEDGVWDFVRTHLRQLPVFVTKGEQPQVIGERERVLLFDRMVAFHVQRGVGVPLSAGDFYQGLAQRFPERDGMYFLSEQIADYERRRMAAREAPQLELFVSDEATAIQWLKQQLTRKPQTFQEIQPQFMRETQGGWLKHEAPLELSELLEQNFLRFDGSGEVPSQIHSYLSSNFKDMRSLPKDHATLRTKAKDRWYVPDPGKAGDLEKLRERALLRQFDEYLESKQKKLKVFRVEAVRAGFRYAWQQADYATILNVARKISEDVLEEDPMLLMWYTNALTRTGTEQ